MAPVAFDHQLVLLGVLLAIPVLWFLVLRPSATSDTDRRQRYALFATRLVIVACLVTAAAGPHTTTTRVTPGEPEVRLLVDDSASTAVSPDVAAELERSIERRGVPVTTATIATENRSAIGEGIVANLRPDASLVVVSDGQVTQGRSLGAAAELATGVNATISAVTPDPNRRERYVRLDGPETTSVGIENRFLLRVGGTQLDGTEAEVTINIDGTTVATHTVEGDGAIEFTHRFNATGEHYLVARLSGDDVHATNDVFYRSVNVVPQPRVLYVSRSDHPFRSYLAQLYDVTTASSVPSDLSGYQAVVLQDVAASEVGQTDALQRHVIDGGGLLVVGGVRSFEYGGYTESPLGAMLPVRIGPGGVGDKARIVLAIDVSGSTAEGMRTQKAIALDVLNQLGDQHEVGLVAFAGRAYRIADLRPLIRSRADLADKIRRLRSGGKTNIPAGLRGSAELLGGTDGTVILISDGVDAEDPAISAAQTLGGNGIRVITVGVGQQINGPLLRGVASVSGGTYLRADETSRLRLEFGDEDRQFSASTLTLVDSSHFITAGVTLTASLPNANEVAVKDGADYLVATGQGTPAVAAWRYGLGRVVTVTAYDDRGELGDLLSQPDSRLLSKSTNWAIGDPQRLQSGTVSVSDTRVGEPTTVVYRGSAPPEDTALDFVRTGDGRYEAQVVPDRQGFQPLLSAEYAANYRREYGGYGTDPALGEAVRATGGRTFTADQAAEIARFARSQATQVREIRQDFDWLFLVLALVVYLGEVGARRLQGVPRNPFTN